MKKFFINVLIYLTIVSLLVLSINRILINKIQSTNKFDYVPIGIEICNLGSSHGVNSYYYKDIEKKYVCFNFALDSQTLSYDERILEYYQDNLAPGGIVIVDISYFAPWGIPEINEYNFETKNKRYYEILPPYLIKEYDIYLDVIYNRIPTLNMGLFKLFDTIFVDTSSISIPKSYPEISRVVDLDKLKEDVTASCYRHIFLNKRNDDGELFINNEEVQALYDIVEICKKRNVMPIFVTCPYLKEYTDEISTKDEDFFEQFYGLIYEITQQLEVEYFDYSLDERFIYDYSLFYNGDHMNSAGARKFTDILYEEVIKQRISN